MSITVMSLEVAVAFSKIYDLNKYMLATKEGSEGTTQILFLDKEKTFLYSSWLGRAIMRLFGLYDNRFRMEGLHTASKKMLEYINSNHPKDGDTAADKITDFRTQKMRKRRIDPNPYEEIKRTELLARISQYYSTGRNFESYKPRS